MARNGDCRQTETFCDAFMTLPVNIIKKRPVDLTDHTSFDAKTARSAIRHYCITAFLLLDTPKHLTGKIKPNNLITSQSNIGRMRMLA